MDKTDFIIARKSYMELVKDELLGPGSEISIPDREHELISESPEKRYFVGVLYPQSTKMGINNDDNIEEKSGEEEDSEETEVDEDNEAERKPEHNSVFELLDDKDNEEKDDPTVDEEKADETVNLSNQNKPSSLGINFIAQFNGDGEPTSLSCHVNFATYKKARVENCIFPINPDDYDNFNVHSVFKPYMEYDETKKVLRLKQNIKRKDIKKLTEYSDMSDKERDIGRILYPLTDQLKSGYIRDPHSVDFDITFDDRADYCETDHLDNTVLKAAALKRKLSDGKYAISVMLINDAQGHNDSNLGSFCIFQPILTIDSKKNGFSYCSYSDSPDFEALTDEEKSTEMLYRNKKVYGNGMGVSVDWRNVDENGNGFLQSDFFPSYEMPGVDFELPEKYKVDTNAFSMKFLSDLNTTDKSEKLTALNTIIAAYEKWIGEVKEKSIVLPSKYSDIAKKNIDSCFDALKRMKEGLQTLSESEDAWTAFMLANRAMYMQRVHLKIQQKPSVKPYFSDDPEIKELLKDIDYYTVDSTLDDRFAWRPFQIGFLLMSINSIFKDDSIDREIIDLIWFPTGGGKTEAYLGLTAFTIFFRRLHYKDSYGGTNVIMRYTLRLLTAQQFTRASTLICACEYIRSSKETGKYPYYDLGSEEITIGLWIGGAHTPNTIKEAGERFDKLKGNSEPLRIRLDKYNKFQVLKCPWCGTSMVKGPDGKYKEKGEWGYALRKNKSFEMRCTNPACFYELKGKLPVQVVDEELYKQPPTLLFATVDKFAMLPWRENVGAFFASTAKNRSPELIIQDELHLISGPLGTMVGLYESALDYLCSAKGSKTKIIASTATIKKAAEQCEALYDRQVSQFPHPGIDAEDSFFSHESVIDHDNGKFGRLYAGIMPAGKTKVRTEARAIASLMQRLHTMELPDEVKDKYWSLVLYFNSIKELGKCTTLMDDDVRDDIKRIAQRKNDKKRTKYNFNELTSRVPTTQLNEIMDNLERICYTSDEKEENKAMDAVLATNMISVGIDISRLNTMLIVGQPKLTGEYIQASSRVGREYPGMTVVLYDATKSRDRSHYEQFNAFHGALYKYVEPTVATPFSAPARERALHAVVISMLRHSKPELLAEGSAESFTVEKYKDSINEIKKLIIERAKKINDIMNPGAEDESEAISEEIDLILEKWERLAESDSHEKGKFVYGSKFMLKEPDKEKKEGRLLKAFKTAKNDSAFDTMTSMRSVDTMVAGKLLIWEKN